MPLCARAAALVIALCVAIPPLSAQGPPPGTNLLRPLSEAAVAESLAVLKELDAIVRKNPRDAKAWHRRGMIAWALMYRGRVEPKLRNLDWTRLGRMADTSLRLAYEYGESDPRIAIAMAQYHLGTGLITMRAQAYPIIPRALEAARKGRDSAAIAETAIEMGRLYWRRYDAVANRVLVANVEDVIRSIGSAPEFSERCGRRDWVCRVQAIGGPMDFSGETHYARAEEYFREAYAVAPADDRAFRQLAMLLVERQRWRELGTVSRERATRLPGNAAAWMALGLALHRQGQRLPAEAAYDTALVRLDARERAHITQLQRLLVVQDTLSFMALPPDEQARHRERFWLAADPLWSADGNEARTEYYARVTYADLRWTVEELGVRGIDSDRGMIHVRFGPPNVNVTMSAQPQGDDMGGALSGRGFDRPPPMDEARGFKVDASTSMVTLWAYDTGWLFVFHGAPTFATARIPREDAGAVDSLLRERPSLWKNATDMSITEMPAQVARFRARADSVDVAVIVEAPVREMLEAASRNTPIRAQFWLFPVNTAIELRDSTVLRTTDPRSWVSRVAPGTYEYRVEATAEGANVAGRTTALISANADSTGFALHGFGISDVLLGHGAAAPRAAARWDNVELSPIGGAIAAGSSVTMTWENYEFGARDGNAQYAIKVTLQRQYKATLNRIRARIVGSIAGMTGVDRTEDRITFRFDRTTPHSAIIVDQIAIDLDATAPGEYLLILEITDRVTGKTTERTNRFIIRQ